MSADLARELEAVAILRASLADCEDDALVVDMIEGETSFLEAVDKVLDAIVEAGALEEGAKAAASAMNARADRFARRAERGRALLEQALTIADLKKVERPAATLSMAARAPRLIVSDESAIPSRFWEAPPPQLNKRGVTEALKAGEPVPGVSLSNAAPTLTVRIN
jgi:hypothetical protein